MTASISPAAEAGPAPTARLGKPKAPRGGLPPFLMTEPQPDKVEPKPATKSQAKQSDADEPPTGQPETAMLLPPPEPSAIATLAALLPQAPEAATASSATSPDTELETTQSAAPVELLPELGASADSGGPAPEIAAPDVASPQLAGQDEAIPAEIPSFPDAPPLATGAAPATSRPLPAQPASAQPASAKSAPLPPAASAAAEAPSPTPHPDQQPQAPAATMRPPSAAPRATVRASQGESNRETPSFREGQAQTGQAATVRTASAAAQMPPFRLDFTAGLLQANSEQAVLPEAAILAELPTTDLAPPPLADVVIELGATDALDVTIAATDAEMRDRLEAASGELVQDLAAIGAEVEAIQVELRKSSEPSPAARSDDGHPGDGKAGQPAMQQGQQQQQAAARQPQLQRLQAVTRGFEQPAAQQSPGQQQHVDRYA